MARRLLAGILALGLVAFERSSEASEATPVSSNAVARQDAKAPAVARKVPAAIAKRTLSASRQFSMSMLQAISSRTAKAGNSYSAWQTYAIMRGVATVTGAVVGSVTDGSYAGASKDSDVRLPEGTHVIVTLTVPLMVWGRS